MAADQATPKFIVDGTGPYTLDEMLATNEVDDDLCAWLLSAKVGDRFGDIVTVEAVAEVQS